MMLFLIFYFSYSVFLNSVKRTNSLSPKLLKNFGNYYHFFLFLIGIYGWNTCTFIGFHILLPEFQRIIYPAIGNCAMTESETMS